MPELGPRPDHVGSVVDRVTMGEVYLRLLWISPASIIPLMSPQSITYLLPKIHNLSNLDRR